jgi:hypothetical protein
MAEDRIESHQVEPSEAGLPSPKDLPPYIESARHFLAR